MLMNKGYCDNTDCKKGKVKQHLHEVEMLPEFEGGKFHWCTDCINRDGDMVVGKDD
jgi:hypothetical protein